MRVRVSENEVVFKTITTLNSPLTSHTHDHHQIAVQNMLLSDKNK